jgi:hypothetical protein
LQPPLALLIPPREDEQEEKADATAIAITNTKIVFLIFCGI